MLIIPALLDSINDANVLIIFTARTRWLAYSITKFIGRINEVAAF